MKSQNLESNAYEHKNATIIHPNNPNEPLVIEAIGGADFALDLKDPQLWRYFNKGELRFMIRVIPKKAEKQ